MEDEKAEQQEQAEREANFNPRPWSDSMGDPRKQYGDVRDQLQKSRHAQFTLAQHKAFFEQAKRGESLYVQAED